MKRKHFENAMWVLAILAILGVGLSDPGVWSWLKENLALVATVALIVSIVGALAFVAGYIHGLTVRIEDER